MKKINLILKREIIKGKGQFIAAALVVLIGVTAFLATYTSYLNLNNSAKSYYDKYNLLDYYAQVKSISDNEIQQVGKIQGVKNSSGRICVDITGDMGSDRRATLRAISVPDNSEPEINRLHFVKGSFFDSNSFDECLISDKFASFYKLKTGDTVKTNIQGNPYEFKIHGIVNSPEYVYAIKSAATLLTSDGDFGIIYIKESQLKKMTGAGDAFNQVHFTLSEQYNNPDTIKKIENALKPAGFLYGMVRKDLASYAMLSDDINMLEELAVILPLLFLSVAAMIIYVILKRVVNNQRTLIGVMKAFGYSDKKVLKHYISYSLLVALTGAVPGTIFGMGLGALITRMYTQFYNIPELSVKIYWTEMLLGILVSIIFSLVAGYNSTKKILKLEPAQSMRSEPPVSGNKILVEKIKPLWKKLSFGWKMSIRNIFRARQRAVMTMMGFVFTIVLLVGTLFFLDSMNYISDEYYKDFQRQDYKVLFNSPVQYDETYKLLKTEGINKLDPILELPVEIIKDNKKSDMMLTAIGKDNTLYKLKDKEDNKMTVPKGGVILPHSMAEKISVNIGDVVTIKSHVPGFDTAKVKVVGIMKQYIGFSCYMNIEDLKQYTQNQKLANAALIKVNDGMDGKVQHNLYQNKSVDFLESRLTSAETFDKFTGIIYIFIGVLVAFALVMGGAIVFNSTVINIMERKRELASLKALGYSLKEIKLVILRENMLLGFLSLVPGLILGRLMCGFLANMFNNNYFVMPVIVNIPTYIIAALSIFVFAGFAQFANRKNMTGLDMVETLKNREG